MNTQAQIRAFNKINERLDELADEIGNIWKSIQGQDQLMAGLDVQLAYSNLTPEQKRKFLRTPGGPAVQWEGAVPESLTQAELLALTPEQIDEIEKGLETNRNVRHTLGLDPAATEETFRREHAERVERVRDDQKRLDESQGLETGSKRAGPQPGDIVEVPRGKLVCFTCDSNIDQDDIDACGETWCPWTKRPAATITATSDPER